MYLENVKHMLRSKQDYADIWKKLLCNDCSLGDKDSCSHYGSAICEEMTSTILEEIVTVLEIIKIYEEVMEDQNVKTDKIKL